MSNTCHLCSALTDDYYGFQYAEVITDKRKFESVEGVVGPDGVFKERILGNAGAYICVHCRSAAIRRAQAFYSITILIWLMLTALLVSALFDIQPLSLWSVMLEGFPTWSPILVIFLFYLVYIGALVVAGFSIWQLISLQKANGEEAFFKRFVFKLLRPSLGPKDKIIAPASESK